MSDPLEFDEKWQALLQRFVARLVERMRAIGDAWHKVQSGADTGGSARIVLFHEVHSLSGSGATFGFEELSAAARRLEPLLDPERIPAARIFGVDELARIQALLDDLGTEMHRINPAA